MPCAPVLAQPRSAQFSTFPHSYTLLPPDSCLVAPSFSLSQCESSFLCLLPHSLSPSTNLFALPFLDSRRPWVHPETHGGQADTFIAIIVAHTHTHTHTHTDCFSPYYTLFYSRFFLFASRMDWDPTLCQQRRWVSVLYRIFNYSENSHRFIALIIISFPIIVRNR